MRDKKPIPGIKNGAPSANTPSIQATEIWSLDPSWSGWVGEICFRIEMLKAMREQWEVLGGAASLYISRLCATWNAIESRGEALMLPKDRDIC